MVRGKKRVDDVQSLAEIEAKLIDQLADISRRKSEAEAKERDAGRSMFLGALEKVRIAPMEPRSARQIAKILEAIGGDALASKLAD